MKRLTRRQKTVSLVVAMQMIFCQASPLLAMPKGEHVTGGDVSFSRQGDTLTILQTSHKAIVNFDSFSIGAPESVQFIQPDSSAAILNRVTGDQGSVIAGIMLANGNVYLINPNGILFSSTAKISVASLFASALDITDADFLSGRLLFSGGSGSVINQGEITATERAGLFGSIVENSGVIKAANVLMAAATTSIEIDNAAGGVIRLIVDGQVVDPRTTTESPALGTPVPHSDTTTAPAGTTAPDTSTETVPVAASPSGTIQIPSDSSAAVAQDAATAGMVINQGTVSASGDSGGSVTMSGIRVGQFGIVSANGSSGNGGVVNITASDTVALGETSVTTSNAGPNGNGGTVTVFSPDTALFRKGSKIEARGGSETGDGGFIEVSGRQHVEIYGTTDASAQNGKAGTFLIDPSDVTLANSPPGDGDWIPGGGPPYTQFNPNTDTATADIGILLGSLQNNNVIITTMNGSGVIELGNITVANSINLDGTGGHQLSLQADNNIIVNANITDLTPGTADATIISLQADNNVSINALIDTGGGTLSINAVGNVSLNGDIITDGGSFISAGHNFTSTAGSTITTGGGDVNMLGHSGAVSINDTIDTTGGAGQIRIYGTSITLNQNINPVVLNSGGAILLRTADITIDGNVVGPSVTIADTTGIGIGLGATTVPGGLNVSGTELQHITTAALELDTAGSITVDNITAAESLNVNVLTLDAGTAISFANNGSTFRALVGQADNGITIGDYITTVTGSLSLDGDADNAADGSDNITFADGIQLTSDGSLTLDATTGDMTAAGALALVANNGVSVNDSLSGPPAAGIVLISADADANGSGTATIAAGATVNEFTGLIMISANDLNLQGNLSADSIIIAESHGGGIGLGATPGGLTINGSALQRIATADLTLATPGSIIVNNIAASDSLNSGAVTLSAGGSVAFAGSPSTFDSLIVRANDGVSVNTDLATGVGNISIDGDYDNAADINDNIQFAAGVTVASAGSLSIEATTGGMTGSGALTLDASSGISVLNNLTTAGLTTLNADTDATGGGDLLVATGTTLNTLGNGLSITANDLDLQGSLQAGAAFLIDSDGTGIGLGGTPFGGGLNVSGTELQRITTSALELDTTGSITVNGISALNSANANDITLNAGNAVLFDTAASTFDSLEVLADNGITVNRNLTSVVGSISLDGDADNAADGSDNITFADGIQLTSAGSLTLKATTGDMTAAGALALVANNGVSINDSLSGPPAAGIVLISADADANGSGTATIAAGATVNEFTGLIMISANDLNLQGNLSADSIIIAESHGGGIGLGATPGGLTINGSALQRIATADLTLATPGSIIVNNIAASDSLNSGAVTLSAGGSVAFAGSPSTFDSLIVRANDGVSVNTDLATGVGNISIDGDYDNAADINDNIQFAAGVTVASAGSLSIEATTGGMTGSGALTLDASSGISVLNNLTTAGLTTLSADTDATGGGDLLVAAGTTLNTLGNGLSITANDLDLQGSLQAGAAFLIDSDGTGIGLGGTPVGGGLNVSGTELQRITTSALELDTTGSITVNGISALNSANANDVTLNAGNAVLFDTAASTFDSLEVLADNGITVNRNLTSVVGSISLDGDADNAADGSDSITFADGIQLTSAGSLTLKATTGDMTGSGALTLNANNGIIILDNLTTAGLTTLNADTDAAGGGDLTVAAGASINAAGNNMVITANDVNLQGNLLANTALIIDSDGTGIGLGATSIAGGLNVDSSEMQRMTTTALELNTTGFITVDGISAVDSQNAGSVTLDAGGSITFENNPSAFTALTALADNGIVINLDLATTTGNMSLDGDADNAAGISDSIQFAADVRITSAGNIIIAATTGGMTSTGALTLNANGGISVLDSLTTGGLTTLDADSDNASGGDLTVAAGATINTAGNNLIITANDMDLQGNLQAGTMQIVDSDGTGIGLGATAIPGGLNIDGDELQRVTATALELNTAGSIAVNGISPVNSQNADAVTLVAAGSVFFNTSPSTFDSLTVLADNGIVVNQDLTTAVGNISLDGDADNTADGIDSIRFADGVQVTSAGSLTLKATTGDMAGSGALTLNANNGIMILDNLTTAGDLTANDDTTVANGVVLRAGSDLTVSDGSWVRGLGALNIFAGDHLTLGSDVTSASTMDLLADYNRDGTGLLWIKGNISTDGAVPSGTITLVGEIKVDGTMTVGAPNLSLSGADRDDVDYSIMAPIRAGGIVIRMGHSIYDATAGEANLLLAGDVSLTARTGSIGGGGAADIDTATGTLRATARGHIYIDEADSLRIAGGVKGGGLVNLDVNGSITGDSVTAGRMLIIAAAGDINCANLASGDLMDLDSASLEFDTLTASSVDADTTGGIAMGQATLTGLADFKAGGTISDHDSMITAKDIYLIAGGNIGGSAIEMNVDRISLIQAGGLVHIRQHAAGPTSLGLISAGDHFEVEVPNGGFSDGNGDGTNFRAGNDSYLALHGTCGGLCDPLQIEIDPGHLHVNGINLSRADHQDDWVWISLERTLGHDPLTGSQIEYVGNGEIPGLIFFNGAAVLGTEAVSVIPRTEAFTLETPELKSRQGVFGSPYFLHTYMNIREPIALGVVDYMVHGLASVGADPEFPKTTKQKITMWPKGYSW